MPGRQSFLLSDTVGFIENIPHDLIKAFRSTLAEVKYADVLFIVIDSSDPHHEMHKKITEDTLRDLDALTIPRIYVYNKADLRDEGLSSDNRPDTDSVYISAKTGYGMDRLIERLYGIFEKGNRKIDVLIPYTSGDILNRLHTDAEVISESFEEEGTRICAICPVALADYVESVLT